MAVPRRPILTKYPTEDNVNLLINRIYGDSKGMPDRVTLLRSKLAGDDMVRHGTMMVAFTGIGSLLNYLYQLAMGWLLSPEEYGILISLLSLLVIVSVFSSAVDTTVTKFVSMEYAHNSFGRVNYLWKFFLKRTLLLSSGLFVVLALLGPMISSFLNLGSNWYVWILLVSLVPAFCMSANFGVLRGLERFLHLGMSGTLWAFLKLGIAIFLVYMGLRAGGAILSLALASLIVFSVSIWFLRDVFKAGNESFKVSGVRQYAGLAFLAVLALTALTNMDVIFAKHYLSQVDAGNYSAISVMGKIIFYMSGGVAVVMFPKTSRLSEQGGHQEVFRKSAFLTVLLVGGPILVYWLFPNLIINVLFLGKYQSARPYLFTYALAMALFAISNLLVYYLLSLNKAKIAYFLTAAALAEICLIILFHSSILQIVNVVLFAGVASVTLSVAFYLGVKRDFRNNASVQ